MTRSAVLLALGTLACASAAKDTARPDPPESARQAILALADDVLAAARARDAERFASHFADRPGFVYLINARAIRSPDELRETFASMLSRQRVFDPAWSSQAVDVLSPSVGVFTGEFSTRAETTSGETWSAEGVVTFVAMRDGVGWRVVQWHTTE